MTYHFYKGNSLTGKPAVEIVGTVRCGLCDFVSDESREGMEQLRLHIEEVNNDPHLFQQHKAEYSKQGRDS